MDLGGKRVLITGGAGMIGSTIADQLVPYGVEEIVVLDNFVRGRKENLAWVAEHGPLTVIEGDIRDRAVLGDAAEGIDLIFHQAAIRITQCAEEPRLALEVLVDGTFNVLEAAVERHVGRLISASSASVYGLAEAFPTDERHHPYGNTTFYGAGKLFGEAALRSFTDMYGLNYVALRYFNVYGPRMDVYGVYTEVLVRWMERIDAGKSPLIFGSGSQTMDFIYVEDVARANVLAACANVTDEVFNVASGVEVSLQDLATTLLEVMDSDLDIEFLPEERPTSVSRRLAATSRASEAIGFTASVDLHEGLRRLVAFWRSERTA